MSRRLETGAAKKRHAIELWAGLLGVLAIAASFAAPYFGLPAEPLRRPCIAAIWLLWLGFVVLLPLGPLRSGKLRHKTGDVDRLAEPGRFWLGLMTYTVFMLFVFCFVTVVCWHAWHGDPLR